jgi:hypothetical protein
MQVPNKIILCKLERRAQIFHLMIFDPILLPIEQSSPFPGGGDSADLTYFHFLEIYFYLFKFADDTCVTYTYGSAQLDFCRLVKFKSGDNF